VLKINVAELRIMMRLVQMMDLRLKFLDAFTVVRARQFKSARGRRRGAIDQEKIENRRNSPADEDENRPNPFAIADGVNEHPDLERGDGQPKRIGQKISPIQKISDQQGEHHCEAMTKKFQWQQTFRGTDGLFSASNIFNNLRFCERNADHCADV
jgi:hypothetical protein